MTEPTAQAWAYPKRGSYRFAHLLGRLTPKQLITAAESSLHGRFEAVEAFTGTMRGSIVLRATAHSATGAWAPDGWVPSRAPLDRCILKMLSKHDTMTVTDVRKGVVKARWGPISDSTVRRYLKRLGAKKVGVEGRSTLWGMS